MLNANERVFAYFVRNEPLPATKDLELVDGRIGLLIKQSPTLPTVRYVDDAGHQQRCTPGYKPAAHAFIQYHPIGYWTEELHPKPILPPYTVLIYALTGALATTEPARANHIIQRQCGVFPHALACGTNVQILNAVGRAIAEYEVSQPTLMHKLVITELLPWAGHHNYDDVMAIFRQAENQHQLHHWPRYWTPQAGFYQCMIKIDAAQAGECVGQAEQGAWHLVMTWKGLETAGLRAITPETFQALGAVLEGDTKEWLPSYYDHATAPSWTNIRIIHDPIMETPAPAKSARNYTQYLTSKIAKTSIAEETRRTHLEAIMKNQDYLFAMDRFGKRDVRIQEIDSDLYLVGRSSAFQFGAWDSSFFAALNRDIRFTEICINLGAQDFRMEPNITHQALYKPFCDYFIALVKQECVAGTVVMRADSTSARLEYFCHWRGHVLGLIGYLAQTHTIICQM